jgi:hypothetical protein
LKGVSYKVLWSNGNFFDCLSHATLYQVICFY